jgi:holliday junction resolvase Hjr
VTTYERGRSFEWKVAKDLTDNGYLVIRAAGSKGAADLVAFKPGEVLFIQCKTGGAGECAPSEWNEFHRLATSVGSVPILAYRPGRQGIAYWLVTGPKVEVRRMPPAVAWTPDQIGSAA